MSQHRERRSTALGSEQEIALTGGRLRYYERGTGAPVLFVHGVLVNAELWRLVVPGIAEAGFRCLTPDWPMGSHRTPMPDADLSPPGMAALVADFIERLDLREVTVVANDSGGAITQLLMVDHPDRIARVVLTSSDCFDRFPPPVFAFLPLVGRLPGGVWAMTQLLRIRALHRLPIVLGWVAKRPVPRETADAWLLPSRQDPSIRRDLGRFLRGAHRRYTLAAAERLHTFERPVLLAWAREDRLFPVALAHRLAGLLPNATVVEIDDCYTFVPQDQPAELTRVLVEFARAAT